MSVIILYLLLFILLIFLRIPVAFALGIATMFIFYVTGAPVGVIAQRLWTGLDSFPLVAIPFFILAGELMCSSGILNRLLDFSRLLVGRFKGGLYHINILVSMLFGGINGSAVADSSAVGSLLIPATIDEYGDKELAAAVTASSSVVGPVIPPSLPMLIYVFVASNVSVGAMFAAGIVPGILLGVGMMVVTGIMVRKKKYKRDDTRYTVRDVLRIIHRFLIAIILPFIMVGGILTGIFSPTEAGCIAVLYALFAGFFITRELTLKVVYKAFVRAAGVASIVMIMISVANVAIWWLSMANMPQTVGSAFQQLTSNAWIFILLMIIFYVIVGLFLETAAAIIMLVPVFLPIAMQYGIDPIHFGLVTVLALILGLVTPPVALCLYIASGIAKTPFEKVFVESLPLFLWQIFVLLLVAFVPALYLWVPRLLGLVLAP